MVYSNPDVIERICGNNGEDEPNDFMWASDNHNDESSIQKFYQGTTVFVTGGSGFMGMALIEKLLRTCTGIKKLFLLMRPNKEKSVGERTAEMFQNHLFYPLLERYPQILAKVKIVSGDIELPNLGISSSDAEMLKREVDIVFHVAATVRFDEALRKAYHVNVVSLKTILGMAESMTHLKAFVHVSTAFCHTHRGFTHIKEQFYTSPYTEDEVEAILNSADDYTIACLSRLLLGELPTTYILTKVIGEEIIRQKIGKLPIAVYRPGIVIQTYDEPLRGWTCTLQGAGALFVGLGLGILRVMNLKSDKIADIIPVDKCACAMVALPWYIEAQRKKTDEAPPIFHHITSSITYWEACSYAKSASEIKNLVSKFQVWVIHVGIVENKFIYGIRTFFQHVVPLPFLALAEKLQNQPPRLCKVYRKMAYLSDQLNVFHKCNWIFEDKNIQKLWACMSASDRRHFRLNVEDLDWYYYFWPMSEAYGYYILKENTENFEDLRRARIKLKRMQKADFVIRYSAKGLMLYIVYKVGILLFDLLRNLLSNQINRF